MNKIITSQYKPIFNLLIFSIVSFVMHQLILNLIDINNLSNQFIHSLPITYLFFSICSLVILFILIKVNIKSPTNVGMTFMLLTTSKMGIAYVFLKPILSSKLPSSHLEKYNFFIVFALFLTIETVISIKMLNNKQ